MISRVFATFAALAALGPPALAAPGVGQPAPALILNKVGGGTFDLAAVKGHPAIVNFWATWCAPCRTEMPALDQFHLAHPDIAMIGVSVDKARDRDEVAKAAASLHYQVALLSDAEANGFGKPNALPITYVVDAAGTVRDVLIPDAEGVTAATLERAVAPLLSTGASK